MKMLEATRFRYCPHCGEQRLAHNDDKSMRCPACGFIYYHGTAAVAVGLLSYEDKIILTWRANEPKKGGLALPGGFVDYEENLEEALVREMQEELNLVIANPRYLCSQGERYVTREVVYFCCIAFFTARVNDIQNITARDDIEAFELIRPGEIDRLELAFNSDRIALDKFEKLNYDSSLE